MSFVLDTTAVSELMRGEPSTVARLEREARSEVWIPQPVISEICYGLARLRPSKRKRILEHRFDELRRVIRRVDWTDDVSQRFGEIKAALERRGDRLEDFDLAIAAHALAHEAVLVTANVEHLARVPGLVVESWSRA